jgi:hypothetical protein
VPQDELWACSARLTGWTATYSYDSIEHGQDLLSIRPLFSKSPASHAEGWISTPVPSYMRWSVPVVIQRAHDELLGGLARNVPGVVRRELRQIQLGFLAGESDS